MKQNWTEVILQRDIIQETWLTSEYLASGLFLSVSSQFSATPAEGCQDLRLSEAAVTSMQNRCTVRNAALSWWSFYILCYTFASHSIWKNVLIIDQYIKKRVHKCMFVFFNKGIWEVLFTVSVVSNSEAQ